MKADRLHDGFCSCGNTSHRDTSAMIVNITVNGSVNIHCDGLGCKAGTENSVDSLDCENCKDKDKCFVSGSSDSPISVVVAGPCEGRVIHHQKR